MRYAAPMKQNALAASPKVVYAAPMSQSSPGAARPVLWQGCNAGKRSFGLLHNGDVLGCTSIRERDLIEGNVRTRSRVDIWRDPASFAWARNLKKSDLSGDCRECCYGDVCRSHEGITHLKKAVALSTPSSVDACFDLSVVYSEIGQKQDAVAVLQNAEAKQPGFLARVGDFYTRLLMEIGAPSAETPRVGEAEIYRFVR